MVLLKKKKINDLFHYFMNSSNYVFLLLAFTTFHTNPQPGCKQYINYFISFNSIPAQMVSSLSNTELILTFFCRSSRYLNRDSYNTCKHKNICCVLTDMIQMSATTEKHVTKHYQYWPMHIFNRYKNNVLMDYSSQWIPLWSS